MTSLESLFTLHSARSVAFGEHRPGKVAFVTNGFESNGLVGYIEPHTGDRVFNFTGICVSAFAETTVHKPPFIARGNGGSGLVVLEPKKAMSGEALLYYAAFINVMVRWRFSWYRQVSAVRLRTLELPDSPQAIKVNHEVLATESPPRPKWVLNLARFRLEDLFDLEPGEYHALNALSKGQTPMISCGDQDDGIVGYFEVDPEHLHQNRLTIALNGSPLLAKWHPYTFAAKDDVAVCTPKQPLLQSTVVFVQMMLNRERWRYSYYRKCYMTKLKRFEVALPTREGNLDEPTMAAVVESAPYWKLVRGSES